MSQYTYDCEVVAGPTTPGTVQDWELEFARRSLALLKKRLGDDGINKLLSEDVAESERQWKSKITASDGQLRVAQTDLAIRGLSAEQFLGWFHKIVASEPEMLAAHPEHYRILLTEDGKGQRVMETIGEYVSDFVIPSLGNKTNGPSVTNRDKSFPITMIGQGELVDGTVMGEVLHQFRNHADGKGFDARLGAWFPATFDDDLFETHRRHLAVEFRNWTHAAFLATRQ